MSVLAIYAIGGVLTLVLAAVFYSYAVSTRRSVRCSSCGERVDMEHDRVRHCPSCGGPLP